MLRTGLDKPNVGNPFFHQARRYANAGVAAADNQNLMMHGSHHRASRSTGLLPADPALIATIKFDHVVARAA